jgi:hypothetical protein
VLEFRILGPLEVVDGRGPVRLGGPKQRATLAILLLSAGRAVSVDRLADDLYAGAPPVTAVTQVQRRAGTRGGTVAGTARPARARRGSFSATRSPPSTRRAEHTVPTAPSPTSASMRNPATTVPGASGERMTREPRADVRKRQTGRRAAAFKGPFISA